MADDPERKIHKLKVFRPEDYIRIDTIEILQDCLDAAKRGEITEVVVIAKTPDGFRELASPTTHFAEWIGRLEVQKNGWIMHYLMNEGDD